MDREIYEISFHTRLPRIHITEKEVELRFTDSKRKIYKAKVQNMELIL